MKVIELLNKIANGEEVPKKIRLFGVEFKKKGNEYYSVNTSDSLISYFGEDYLRAELNDEVEILDKEEFEDIEEFEEHKLINTRDILELEMFINKINADYNYKINQLIKNQKKIIEKLNKEN